MTLLKMKLLAASFLLTQIANTATATSITLPSNDTTGINRNMPGQVSFVPGIGTNGKYAPGSTNHFSFYVIGGDNGGVDGFELGTIFNINRQHVQSAQIAGIFNQVGGRVQGFQIAGIFNRVQQSMTAVQLAGITNLVGGPVKGVQVAGVFNEVQQSVNGAQISGVANIAKGPLTGIQITGVYNQLTDSLDGTQVAGITNIVNGPVKGIQISGIPSVARKEVNGVQIAGIVNYAKNLKGVQIGLVNIADSTSGYSIGLINISPQSFYRVAVYANEMMNTNVAFKSGTPRIYGILLSGANFSNDKKMYSFGAGIGKEFSLGKSKMFTLNPELTSQYLYTGTWTFENTLNRIQANVHVKLGKYVSVFAGPAFSVLHSDQDVATTGYKLHPVSSNYHVFKLWDNTTAWFGWNAGITIF